MAKKVTKALLARVKVQPGKEQAVADFFEKALQIARSESQTVTWYAWQIGPNTFGIFDTFEDESGREAHINGQIASLLMEQAMELLLEPPIIEKLDVLAVKS